MRHPVPEVNAFMEAVEKAVYRYLAAGDQAYTEDGLSLADMFKRFETPDAAVIDFCKWYVVTRDNEHSKEILSRNDFRQVT